MKLNHCERVPGVLTRENFGEGTPELLIEVPHGADEQHHYDALRAQLQSNLPERLEKFFWVNTDVGAYALARAIAEAAPVPTLLIRSEIPRTFIDVNRVLTSGSGMTPGLQPYIDDPSDQELLIKLHQRYTAAVEGAYAAVCAEGVAVIPHTYAPRSVPIATIDAQIVENLERVYQPEVLHTCPVRAEVDLITVTPEGEDLAPPGMAETLITALAEEGIAAETNGAYTLHPATMGRVWSERFPHKVLCFEARRDLVTEWSPFVAKPIRPEMVGRIAARVVAALKLGRPDGPPLSG